MDLREPVVRIGPQELPDVPEKPKTREQRIIGHISNVVLVTILVAIGAGVVGTIVICLIALARWLL